MKKYKKLKITLASIIALSLLFFCVDLVRVNNDEKPIFALGLMTADGGGSGKYYSLLYHYDIDIDMNNDPKARTLTYVAAYKAYFLGIKVADVVNK